MDPFDLIHAEELEFQKRRDALTMIWAKWLQHYYPDPNMRPTPAHFQDFRQALFAALDGANINFPGGSSFALNKLMDYYRLRNHPNIESELLASFRHFLLYMPESIHLEYNANHTVPLWSYYV